MLGGYEWEHRPETNDLGIVRQNFIENACRLPERMDGMIVVDIGAHIGAVSRACALRGAQVVAAEPSADSYRLLEHNTDGLEVLTWCVGVGPSGVADLYRDAFNSGMGSLDRSLAGDGALTEPVRLVSLTAIMAAVDGRCDFLKLDCEGGEVAAIREIAARDLWASIGSIFVEFHEQHEDELRELLRAHYAEEALGSRHFLYTEATR